MVKKTEERKETNEESKDIFKTWVDSYTAVSKIWEDSYSKLYKPWFETTSEQVEKLVELSKDAAPEKYKEFYALWLNTYQETYGKLLDIQSTKSSKEVFESFVRCANVNLNLTRSWIAALEKLSQKAKELSKQNTDPETYKEFYNLWAKTYEKAFDNFFENIPTISPFKEILEPVKNAAKLYADTFTNISKIWMKSYQTSASAV